jgi:hypothetical protein
LVDNFSFVETVTGWRQRDGDAIGGNNNFQMLAYVPVKSIETRAQIPMIVQGQHTGMRTEPEGAKRPSQAKEFDIQLFRMSPFGGYQVPQRRGSRVHCVQDPKLGNLASEEFGAAGDRVPIAMPFRRTSTNGVEASALAGLI